MSTIKAPITKTVGTFPSSSRPKLKHKVTLTGGTVLWCSCEGWRYNRKCWHMTEVIQKMSKTKGTKRGPKAKK